MRVGSLLFLTIIFIVHIFPQNNKSFDKITVMYNIQQVRYVSQKEKPAMKAGYDTDVFITLQHSKEIELDQVPDSLLLKAESALELRPKNLCFIIDISDSMNEVINSDNGKIRLDLAKETCLKMINEVIKENDIVSVIAFYHRHDLVIKHKYIRNTKDREELIYAIEKLKPIERGNTFMRQGFAAGYTLINEIKDKEHYNHCVLLLTDGEQIENEQEGESKERVNELVKKNKEEGIGTNVSTVSFSKDADISHMNKVAELGGGSSLFIENEENVPSRALLAALTFNKKELQNQIYTEWKNAEFDVTLALNHGVSFQNADPDNEQPQIKDNTLIYPHIRLSNLISLNVSLSEDVVNKKSTIMTLSVTSSDESFSQFLKNYPISLNHQVMAKGETGFVTIFIRNYN
jgi:Mg-chelatase subunit ChlD